MSAAPNGFQVSCNPSDGTRAVGGGGDGGAPKKRRRNRGGRGGGRGAAASSNGPRDSGSDDQSEEQPRKHVIVDGSGSGQRPATAVARPIQQQQPARQDRRQEGAGHARPQTASTGRPVAHAGQVVGTVRNLHAAPAAHFSTSSSDPAPAPASVAAAPGGTSGIDERFLSTMRWSDQSVASRLSAPTRRALTEVFRFERLSKVQAATLPQLLDGRDVFAKAKTGAGKTLSFLIPAVEQLLAAGPSRGGRVGILIISPTRELAQQIMNEAGNLLRFQSSMHAMIVIGGTNINGERQRMTRGGSINVDVLVATPGRCVDHIESTPGFPQALAASRVLILDEADRLLDMGFKPALDKILSCLPPVGGRAGAAVAAGGPRPRQTMLFSATVPEGVQSVALRCMRPGYDMVDTVGTEEPQTNAQVHQEVLVTPATSVIPALARVLAHIARSDPAHKVIVFFTTARLTGYMAGLFEKMPMPNLPGHRPGAPGPARFNIVEMHSRKSQSYRTGAAERFRTARGILMFSSDVSARGMDYPDISHVVQVGLTDKESYIHRVGRTARAGKSGAGILLLSDYEAHILLHELREIPLHYSGPASALTGGAANGVPGTSTGAARLGASPDGGRAAIPVAAAVAPPVELASLLAAVPGDRELRKESLQCYSATLGYYNSHLKKLKWDKPRLATEVNALMLTLGLEELPMMSRETLGKMGLRGTPGIREAPKGWKPTDGDDM